MFLCDYDLLAYTVLSFAGKLNEAIALAEGRYQRLQAHLGENHPYTHEGGLALGTAYSLAKKYQESADASVKAYTNLMRFVDPAREDYADEFDTAQISVSNAADEAFWRDDYVVCAQRKQQLADLFAVRYGKEHPLTAEQRELAKYYELPVKSDEATRTKWTHAEKLRIEAARFKTIEAMTDPSSIVKLEESLKLLDELLPKEHPIRIATLRFLARFYYQAGTPEQKSKSAGLIKEVASHYERIEGKEHRYYEAMKGIAVQFLDSGDNLTECESLLSEMEEYYRTHLTSLGVTGTQYHASALLDLGFLRIEQKKHSEAELLLLEGSGKLRPFSGDAYLTELRDAGYAALGQLYQDTGVLGRKEFLAVVQEAMGDKTPGFVKNFIHWEARIGAMSKVLGGDDSIALMWLASGTATAERSKAHGQHVLDAWLSHRLAQLKWAKGDFKSAFGMLEEALDLNEAYQKDAYASVPVMAAEILSGRYYRAAIDDWLSLPWKETRSADAIYAHVLEWKNSVFDRRHGLSNGWNQANLKSKTEELDRLASKFATEFARIQGTAEVHARVIKLAHDREISEHAARKARRDAIEQDGSEALNQLQRYLPEDVVVVDFVGYLRREFENREGPSTGERHVAAFVVRSMQPVVRVDLGSGHEINQAAGKWIAAVAKESIAFLKEDQAELKVARGEISDASSELAKRIWEPVRPYLMDATTIVYAPDVSFSGIPLHALNGDISGSFFANFKSFVMMPSAKWLDECLSRKSPPKSLSPKLLAVGGIDYETPPTDVANPGIVLKRSLEFSPLEGSGEFVQSLGKRFKSSFPTGTTAILNGANATEEVVRSTIPGSHFIHIDTHGFLVTGTPDNPKGHDILKDLRRPHFLRSSYFVSRIPAMQSGIALASANRYDDPRTSHDGIFWGYELSAMNFTNADLVVTAACQTAAGSGINYEGLAGLQLSLHLAGARSTVGTLWAVANSATIHLMEEFYSGLWQDKLTKAEALKRAQLKLRDQYDFKENRWREQADSTNPLPIALWAPFVLSGDWR